MLEARFSLTSTFHLVKKYSNGFLYKYMYMYMPFVLWSVVTS